MCVKTQEAGEKNSAAVKKKKVIKLTGTRRAVC